MSTSSPTSIWNDEMALRRPRSTSSIPLHNGLSTRKPEGAVRRTQMITTYGVGSMVALGDQSFIVSGLDSWDTDHGPAVYEPNLQHWLGVDELRLPPAANPAAGDGVRVRLFPEMYSCAECTRLQRFSAFGSPRGKSECGACSRPLTPSRFVIACPNGHLDDFPYWEWVHHKTGLTPGTSTGRHELQLETKGDSASLRSVIISCSCGADPVSMQGAFGRSVMRSLDVGCRGRRPWLGAGSEETGCPEIPRALQRGSSAAWFPIQRSSLSIPPWSNKIQKLIDKYSNELRQYTDGSGREAVLSLMAKESKFTVAQIITALEERHQLATENLSDDDVVLDASTPLRRKEYVHLEHGTVGDEHVDFECEPPPRTSTGSIPHGLGKIMLVKRLREVRALQSFTRVEMPDPARRRARRAALSAGPVNWLPAIEVNGEGVFLTLDDERLRTWECSDGPRRRAEQIRENHTRQMHERSEQAAAQRLHSPISPRFVLLHTLAHALINEWSLDCGYPAAALRERIYCSNEMSGILIYTASSDSAGSLGGVVAQGDPARLRASLSSAINRISWCSQDPPCMESEATGTDNLNLAACYACVLLPETSCENNNSFLDRAVLIGTPEFPEIGYYTGQANGLGSL